MYLLVSHWFVAYINLASFYDTQLQADLNDDKWVAALSSCMTDCLFTHKLNGLTDEIGCLSLFHRS